MSASNYQKCIATLTSIQNKYPDLLNEFTKWQKNGMWDEQGIIDDFSADITDSSFIDYLKNNNKTEQQASEIWQTVHDAITVTNSTQSSDKQNDYDGSKLFYPTYCYAKTATLEYINDKNEEKQTSDNKFDYYMTIGLNSNIKKEGFSRKNLNLIILLDVSGSMGWAFNNDTNNKNKTKMIIANEAVVCLLNHLTENDRFGLITFEDRAKTIQPLQLVKDINLNNLKTKILKLREGGGTNFGKAYKAASKALQEYSIGQKQNMEQYDNRIIMLTDAQPNIGVTNPNSLLYVVAKNAHDSRKLQELDKKIKEYSTRPTYANRQYSDNINSSDDDYDESDEEEEEDEDEDDDDDDEKADNDDDDETIGLSVGGAKDVNQFRKCIDNNIQPSVSSIPYNGLLYEYYFNTKKRKSEKYGITDGDEKKNNCEEIVENDVTVQKIAPIFTTFIGVGLDFNTQLVSQITDTIGCNYFCVQSTDEFMKRMEDKEFEYMVTPLVFNVCLTLKCEGNVCEIDKVYGAKDTQQQNILERGEIKRINTLFPSNKSKKKGGTKGGIQLVRLKKIGKGNDNINVELIVEYEDRYGKKYLNNQFVSFKPPDLKIKSKMNDMIDSDEDDDSYDDNKSNFYDNLGIRKGILLCRYVELIHLWINKMGAGGMLRINDEYKRKLEKFGKHFEKEMKRCKDKELEKEMKLINKLIKL